MNVVTERFAGCERSREKNALADRLSRRFLFLEARELTARARLRTRLEDFGDPPVDRPLSVLTRSLEDEAELHPLGRFLMRMHLLGILETRLRLAQAWKTENIPLRSVARPVFITGMPRSGSTFLHELLAQDEANRSPRAWEVMFPLPASEAALGERDPRVLKAGACLWWFRRLARGADSVYPLRACTPHECVAIQSYTLMSEEFVSTCRIPGYENFLHSEGMTAAYVWQKRFLQHLQSRRPEKQWVLKSPDHLCSLAELFSVFPDAVIIHTHRDPLEVLKSSIQLTNVLHGLFSRPGDADQLQRQQARALAERVEKSIRFRDAHPELADRFFDVNYAELVSNPIAILQQIYRHLDRPLPPEAVTGMRELISNRTRYRKRANPTVAELRLNPVLESGRFQDYRRRFGIPCQQPQAE
jgi:LPS sulfotransferase NodH